MKTKQLLIALAIVTLAIAPAAAAPVTETAQLSIQQPDYIDTDVTVTAENDSTVYRVNGPRIEIAPKNFDSSDVINYGIATNGGDAQLSHNAEFDEFVFSAGETGSYDVYWSVQGERTVTNETTNETTTETFERRYEATIRVEGKTEMDHLAAGSIKSSEEDAEKWRDFNSTVQELRSDGGLMSDLGLAGQPTTEELIQEMVNAWLTINRPLEMLTGNFTSMVIISTTTLGGWLFMLFIAGPLTLTIGLMYYKYNVKESVEADEGRLSARLAKFEKEKNQRSLAKMKFTDVWGDDHLAGAMQNEGRNVLQATTNWFSKIRDRNIVHSRLQAMGQCGYIAVVDERASTDGGDSEESASIAEAHVEKEDDVSEDADTVGLDVGVDDPLIDALSWDQNEIREFNLVGSEFDRSEIDTSFDLYDFDELKELMEVDYREFEDYDVASKYLIDMFEDVREHPLTDDQGVPDSLRFALEQHLDAANLLSDRFEMPIQYRKELLERALAEHDTAAEAKQTLDDVREGAYA